ncbi:hypothetical protein HNQ77_002570 [Silvibacterium bohemicum]|uniref:Uncharacterized protein n=1 Tax=Silvibacterium bohemicum TaxID=1577686 RepID=A0A841K2Y4_9BACT|nr:hypothetical protein [Silvibacterium bohemicum]MBB6144614.1 hypothetical protein [Silvibacterium bohemicum]
MGPTNNIQQFGRAKNALLDYFIQKLLVPKIYFDAQWRGIPIPVLAIDRAGVGDVHAVLFVERVNQSFGIKGTPPPRGLDELVGGSIEELRSLPCQFRYVAVYDSDTVDALYSPPASTAQRALAMDGVGRIGILSLNAIENEPTVNVLVKPERFRSSKEIVELADQYVAEHTADWEVRA